MLLYLKVDQVRNRGKVDLEFRLILNAVIAIKIIANFTFENKIDIFTQIFFTHFSSHSNNLSRLWKYNNNSIVDENNKTPCYDSCET